jgi:hypothetical protein
MSDSEAENHNRSEKLRSTNCNVWAVALQGKLMWDYEYQENGSNIYFGTRGEVHMSLQPEKKMGIVICY